MKNIKDWTILIYANGNNELEPEIWRAKLEAEKAASGENINVVMQIGREKSELCKLMRPNEHIPVEEEEWSGVRRYYLHNSNSILLSDLGRVNMADSHILYDFIKWGVEKYPSKHKMLVVEGHGMFITVMTDLSQEVPYMMGVPQMCRAINMALRDTGEDLDILVLDTCYANSIELIYELGKENTCAVKYLLTYIKKGPLSGLRKDKIIEVLRQDTGSKNIVIILKDIMNRIRMDLVAVEINHGKLKKIKTLASNLAHSYLTCEKFGSMSPDSLLSLTAQSYPWHNCAVEFIKALRGIVVYPKPAQTDKFNLIDINVKELNISNNSMDIYSLVYLSLGFSRNNYWTNLLIKKTMEEGLNPALLHLNIPQKPIIIHPSTFGKLIWALDTRLTKERVSQITDEVFQYKGWCSNDIVSKLSQELVKISGIFKEKYTAVKDKRVQ